MKLGAYEFEWVPDEMDIPRPEKSVAVQGNFGNVGYFSWGPLLIGKEVKMKWKFVSVAQYEALRAMYLAGGTHVLDLTPETIYIEPPAGGAPVHIPYPDPLYPGALPGPPWERFYIGSVHVGPWAMDRYLFYSSSPIGIEGYPSEVNGTGRVISITDPAASYIDVGPWEYGSGAFPDFRIGDVIFDGVYPGDTWAVIVPHDATAREAYLYPRTPSASDKIYYANASSTINPYPPLALEVGDIIYTDYAENGYCIITELGSDAVGTWFKCRAATEVWDLSELIVWTAGEVGTTDNSPNPNKNFNVMPWKTVSGGPFGG